MRALLILSFALLSLGSSHALSWQWMSPEAYIKISTLIAIGTVGPIHETVSPEGILVISAKVKIEQVLHWQFAADSKAPDEIVLYQVDPNNGTVAGGTLIQKTDSGRCFLMLQQNGFEKFCPIDPSSVQKLDKETIQWPTQRGETEQVPLARVISEIKAASK